MISLQGLLAKDLKAKGLLPQKFNDLVMAPKVQYTTESYLINDQGVGMFTDGLNGWRTYPEYGEFSLEPDSADVMAMLAAERQPSLPRYQGTTRHIRFRTPQDIILTQYLATQYWDDSCWWRQAHEWKLWAYRTEADLLSNTNGVCLDTNSWESAQKNQTKTISLNNFTPYRYYCIEVLSVFEERTELISPENKEGTLCSFGSVKLWGRIRADQVLMNSAQYINDWNIYNSYEEVWNILRIDPSSNWQRWQQGQSRTTGDLSIYAYLRAPKKGKLSRVDYKTWFEGYGNNYADHGDRYRGRCLYEGRIFGFNSESDLLAWRNGTHICSILDVNPIHNYSKTILLGPELNAYQHYGLWMKTKFSGNNTKDWNDSQALCCWGQTNFYMTDIEE